MKKYIISDLIMENLLLESGKLKFSGDKKCFSESSVGRISISKINIGSDCEAKKYGCRKGNHTTVSFPCVWELNAIEQKLLAETLSTEIRRAVCSSLGRDDNGGMSFLVAGLGNGRITPDSIGPLTAEKITVTRHVAKVDPNGFEKMGICAVCSVNCGVLGETGVESMELLRGVVDSVRPNVVIAVDALATKEGERIGRTVQISDQGIVPGAGIGNRQSAIDRDTLGVPVIAIGVPTVISAATLICDSLQRLGICADEKSRSIIEKSTDSYVTLKECDVICEDMSVILATSIDSALGVI